MGSPQVRQPVASSFLSQASRRDEGRAMPQKGQCEIVRISGEGWQTRPYSSNSGDQWIRLSVEPRSGLAAEGD